MHQTKKGNEWHFGMKAHIGVDSRTKIIHSVAASAANIHDSLALPVLLHGQETRVWGDTAYQGQSDVFVMNPKGTITAPTFGGGANALVTELLGERATISSDFGGNPPYEKMFQISKICFKYWIRQSNVLFIIGGKANNTDIYETFRAMADALRDHFNTYGPTPLFVVIGRGGPNLIRGMSYMRDTLENLKLPYKIFGHDSAMSEVVNYALNIDMWMEKDGRKQVAESLGITAGAKKAAGAK